MRVKQFPDEVSVTSIDDAFSQQVVAERRGVIEFMNQPYTFRH